jgi:chloramphenicol 3-O-phosphotransferase
MNKNKIRLTESQLHRVIKESVRKILKESFQSQKLARLAQLHGGIDADYSGQWARNSISTLTDNKIYDKLIFNDKREAWKYIDEHYQNYGDKWICALYDCVLVFNDGKAIIVGGLQGEKQYIQRKQYNQGDKYGGYISNNRYYSNLIDNYKLKNKNEDEYNAHKNPYFNFEKSQRAYKIRNAIMKLRRQGWTDEQILAKYPKIKPWLW